MKVNLPIITAGLLLGHGDFGASICNAVNFGEDCDCTGASTGAILGILNPSGIEEKWLAPIGRDLILNPEITGLHAPNTLEELSYAGGTFRYDLFPAKTGQARTEPCERIYATSDSGASYSSPLRAEGGTLLPGGFQRSILPLAVAAEKRA